jgi:hypothetical protein
MVGCSISARTGDTARGNFGEVTGLSPLAPKKSEVFQTANAAAFRGLWGQVHQGILDKNFFCTPGHEL